jgi:hypothetical protein
LLKKITILISILCFVSCPGHQGTSTFFSNDYKKIYKTSICDESKSFPQMIMIPFFEGATQVVPNCETYPKHQTALAMMVFYHHWVKYFGDSELKIKQTLEKAMVTWGAEKKTLKLAYNMEGEKIVDATVIGLTQSSSLVWVWQGYGHKISESSLIHELVHLSLRALNGHGDYDHEGTKRDGWTPEHTKMIVEAKNMLRSFNI